MGGAYFAAFILPVPTAKLLTEIGWEFNSSARLAESVIADLQKTFCLQEKDDYSSMSVYEGEGVKLTAIRDSSGEIENISVQLRGRKPEELRAALASAGVGNVEVFSPTLSEAGRQAGVH